MSCQELAVFMSRTLLRPSCLPGFDLPMSLIRFSLWLGAWVACLADISRAETYQVGPDKPMRHPGHVSWEQLNPGDVVEIHWRPDPYRFKWAISRAGTAEQPITVRGIRNDKGEAPVIEASRASTPTGLQFPAPARSVIKIGTTRDSGDTPPAHIVIENLNIQGAHPENFFLGNDGLTEYATNASAIYVESGHHITIRNCRLHDCGNGLFVAPDAEEVLVEGCEIFENGIEGSVYEHNAYSESTGMIYQFNRFGPLRAGSRGNNLKDRSAGLIVRYNRIEGGNRQLDLVDSQEGMAIRNDPRYHLAQVYGTLLIEYAGPDNNQIVHFGGDSGDDAANRRSLLFYHNTIISARKDKTVLMRLSTNMQKAEIWNNVIYTNGPGSSFAILDETGQANLRGNFIKPGWKKCFGELKGSVIANDMIEHENPGFSDPAQGDYRPGPSSELRDHGVTAPPRTLPVEFEPPVINQPGKQRMTSRQPDPGCFEGK